MVLVESGRESSGRSRDRRNFLYAGMVRVDGDLHREDGIFPVRGDGLLALAYRPQPGREGACSVGFSAGARPFGR